MSRRQELRNKERAVVGEEGDEKRRENRREEGQIKRGRGEKR